MKKMTKTVIGVMGLMFFCMLSAISYGKTAQAETVIPLGDTWTNGYWAEDDTTARHRYQFTIPSDGKVTVTCQSSCRFWDIYLKDKDYSETYNSGYEEADSTDTFSEYLKAGTYGIEFYSNSSYYEGAYKFKVKFDAVGCNVPEPNNDFVSATPISLNRLQMGVLTDTNEEDYFKLQLRSATTLKVVTTGEESRYVTLYNGDFIEIDSFSYYSGGARVFEKYVSPGTYYIKIDSNHDTPYTLKCVAYQYITNIQLRYSQIAVAKGKTVNLLSSVTPNNATQKTLKWTTSDSSVATVSSTGRVTARGVGYANITAASIDGSNIEKRATVIVKPAKASLKKIKLSKYNKRQILIKVKSQKNVNYQYQYSKNKKFKKAKSIRSSSAALTTSKLSKKKKYYVRVRAYYTYAGKNYYGAWSKAKSIRTKK